MQPVDVFKLLTIKMLHEMPKLAIFGGTFNPIHWGHLLLAEMAVDQFQLDRVIWVPTFRPSYKAHSLLAFEQRLEMVRRATAGHPAFTVSTIEQQSGTSYAIVTFNALQALEPNALWHWIIGDDAFQSLPKWYDSQALIAHCIWLVAPRVREGVGQGEMERGEAEGKRQKAETHARTASNPSTAMAEALQLKTDPMQNSLAQRHVKPFLRNALRTADTKREASPTDLVLLKTLPSTLRWHPLQMPSIDISSSVIRQRCRDGRSIRYWVPEAVHSYITEQNLYQMS